MRFLKNRIASLTGSNPTTLGPLEISVLEILWTHGECSVNAVIDRMDRPLAYTTIMTTLDRLYKKGILDRHKCERAFLYSTRHTRPEWEQKRAGDFMAGFLAGPQASSEMLISCLVEAVSEKDAALLDELELRIRLKRKQIDQGRGK